MSRTVKIAAALVAVVIVGGGVLWYTTLRSTAPPPAQLDALDDELAGAGTTGSARTGSGADGTWTVQRTDDGFVGYRINELYGPGATLETEVAGRTSEVTGSFTVEGTTVRDGSIEVDMTTLESDRSRRDETLKFRGLETDTFPTATFTFTEPIDLPSAPVDGVDMTIPVTGELTLHGQTRPVTVDITARWTGDAVSIRANVPITLADYGIEAISIEQFVAVDEQGTLELLLLFSR